MLTEIVFIDSFLVSSSLSFTFLASRSGNFTIRGRGRILHNYVIRGWMGPKTILNVAKEKAPWLCRESTPCLPVTAL
jgi:hypothetical protein